MTSKYLKSKGYKILKINSEIAEGQYIKGRVCVDLNISKMYLIRYKEGDTYAILHLPTDVDQFELIESVLLNQAMIDKK